MSRALTYLRGTRTASDWNNHQDYACVWITIVDEEVGETLAEFQVYYDNDARGLCLEAFDDAWPIFAEYPTLAPELGKLDCDPTLDHVVALLERLGAAVKAAS